MTTNNDVDVSLSGQTGTVAFVGATSPVLVTPTLGAATATTITFNPTTSGMVGTTTNDDASAGIVGQIISSSVLAASAVTIPAPITPTDVTSISLTAGDWDVWGNVVLIIVSGTVLQFNGWVNSASATEPDLSLRSGEQFGSNNLGTGAGLSVPKLRFSLASTTTMYLSVTAGYVTASSKACGGIYARRVR